MRSRTVRWLAAWNVVVTVLLLSGVTTNGSGANAAIYSVSSTQDNGGDGSSATADDLIETTTPDALVAVTTTGLSTAHPHICLVTASAEASFVANGTYIFGISLDGAATTTAASNRRIEMFNNQGIADDSFEEVSTTMAFANLMGDHTFTFSARKSAAANGNLNVSASSITAVCQQKDL
jgi:hypothetical protein